MEQEKKGGVGRLWEFWKEKTEEADGGIGFWSGGKMEGKTAAENRQDALSQEKAEKKPFFWEETVRTAKEKKAEEAEAFGQDRRRPFAEEKTAEAKGPALRTAEESTQERKTIAPIFTAEIFREKTERREAEERRKTIFMQEAPFAEQEKRKTIPIVAETGLAEKAAAAEEAEELPQEDAPEAGEVSLDDGAQNPEEPKQQEPFEPKLPEEYADLSLDADEEPAGDDEAQRPRLAPGIKVLLYVCCVLAASVLLAVVGWQLADDVLALTKPDEEITITVP